MTPGLHASSLAPPRSDPGRARRVTEALLLLLLALHLVRWVADPAHRRGHDDFAVFYDGAWQIAHRIDPYASVHFAAGPTDSGFVSPPWFALVVAPFTLLPYPAAASVWLAVNLGLLAICLLLAQRLCGWKLRPQATAVVFLVLAWTWPLKVLLHAGQNSLLVLAAALAATLALERGRPWECGAWLVVAASKPQLVFLLGLGLALHAWRRQRTPGVVAGAILTAGLSLLACLALTPEWVPEVLALHPRTWRYWDITITLRTLLATMLGRGLRTDALYLVLLAAGTASVAWRWLRSSAPIAELAGWTLALTLLVTPYAQLHDYVLLILPATVLARRLGSTTLATRLLALAGALLGEVLAIEQQAALGGPHRFAALLLPLAATAAILVPAAGRRREAGATPDRGDLGAWGPAAREVSCKT